MTPSKPNYNTSVVYVAPGSSSAPMVKSNGTDRLCLAASPRPRCWEMRFGLACSSCWLPALDIKLATRAFGECRSDVLG